ncbi:hypothetical protein [Neptunomonas phycophila]|jgi:hypothetical protein|uniref:Uncharacterized protein n=1 Tax=Neptunomonas phycophila TaxID=1572645 RepID=A0AAW7XHT4_9GAMM|nr:hypothetical protein [Neptunomonas phycophila]MDO6453868.1 hypothetical protein [Neptunomonas phycophila]
MMSIRFVMHSSLLVLASAMTFANAYLATIKVLLMTLGEAIQKLPKKKATSMPAQHD